MKRLYKCNTKKKLGLLWSSYIICYKDIMFYIDKMRLRKQYIIIVYFVLVKVILTQTKQERFFKNNIFIKITIYLKRNKIDTYLKKDISDRFSDSKIFLDQNINNKDIFKLKYW